MPEEKIVRARAGTAVSMGEEGETQGRTGQNVQKPEEEQKGRTVTPSGSTKAQTQSPHSHRQLTGPSETCREKAAEGSAELS